MNRYPLSIRYQSQLKYRRRVLFGMMDRILCQVLQGQPVGCTQRMCFTQGTPVCQRYNHHRRLLTNETRNQTNQSV